MWRWVHRALTLQLPLQLAVCGKQITHTRTRARAHAHAHMSSPTSDIEFVDSDDETPEPPPPKKPKQAKQAKQAVVAPVEEEEFDAPGLGELEGERPLLIQALVCHPLDSVRVGVVPHPDL